MRTTLTLDPDVAALLAQEMRRTGCGLKATVNRELRRALAGAPNRRRYQGHSYSFGFRPGTDLDCMNQLSDKLEASEGLAGIKRR